MRVISKPDVMAPGPAPPPQPSGPLLNPWIGGGRGAGRRQDTENFKGLCDRRWTLECARLGGGGAGGQTAP